MTYATLVFKEVTCRIMAGGRRGFFSARCRMLWSVRLLRKKDKREPGAAPQGQHRRYDAINPWVL
jgi:hypothetical protein